MQLTTQVYTLIKFCLGAFCISPVQSLNIKAGKASISLQHIRLAMNYVLKLHSLAENLTYDCVPHMLRLSLTSPLLLEMASSHIVIDVEGIFRDCLHTNISPWSIRVPSVRFLSQV